MIQSNLATAAAGAYAGGAAVTGFTILKPAGPVADAEPAALAFKTS